MTSGGGPDNARERELDTTIESTFPASDALSTIPNPEPDARGNCARLEPAQPVDGAADDRPQELPAGTG